MPDIKDTIVYTLFIWENLSEYVFPEAISTYCNILNIHSDTCV